MQRDQKCQHRPTKLQGKGVELKIEMQRSEGVDNLPELGQSFLRTLSVSHQRRRGWKKRTLQADTFGWAITFDASNPIT